MPGLLVFRAVDLQLLCIHFPMLEPYQLEHIELDADQMPKAFAEYHLWKIPINMIDEFSFIKTFD